MFKVIIKPQAEREFKDLPRKLRDIIYKELRKLSFNPFSHPQAKKISGTEKGYRLRVGRWRILFVLFSKEKRIEIVDIFLKKGKENYFKRKKLLP